MYKVFFKDRLIVLTQRIERDLTPEFNSILKYSNQGELKKFIHNFEANRDLNNAIIYHHNVKELLKKFRDCYTNIKAAGGLVWDRSQNKYLVFKRLGVIDLPKGKMEENETFEQTALREVEEECGIHELEIKKLLTTTFHTYYIKDKPILKETRWFEMVYKGINSPIPQKEENIEAIWWINPENTSTLLKDTYPSIVEVLRASEKINKYI